MMAMIARLWRILRNRYDWVIELPDGTGAHGSVTYRGRRLPVSKVELVVTGGTVAVLALVIVAPKLHVLLNAPGVQIERGNGSGRSQRGAP